ncbi:MAG: hypothetical protein MJ159_06375 [Treponemataceae bacterium]|nr:hypothetical protein [Treponemataceae bacterium]
MNDNKIDQKNIMLFNKIKLLNNIADSIANFGETQCGISELLDKTDLNCGAIPEGSFEQVIDLNAPQQFLSLYEHVAESRFAFAVISLLKHNGELLEPVRQFCFQVGKSNAVKGVCSTSEAFEIFKLFILDGAADEKTKQIISQNPSELVWKETKDVHKEYWEKFGGNVSTYYELLLCFVNGLFENQFDFFIEPDLTFRFSKIKN